jgi:2-keto-4-pentenoate hydratase/2-oxohepta-3-ene-1,7-dioic acid hydratase in catechol pathway
MKLVTFQGLEGTRAGVWLGDTVVCLATAARAAGESADMSSVLAIIEGGDPALAAARRLAESAPDEARIPSASAKLLAPIPETRRNVFCVGRNYIDHVAEGDRTRGVQTQVPKFPQFFTKTANTINHPDAEVPYFTKVTSKLDYEVELALVIGKTGRDIPTASAYEHVFGYTIANDVTAREVQRQHEQWFKGKSLDGSCPLGPWIVTADEIGDPTTLRLSLTLNGEERQNASVSQLIFDIPTIIEQLSAGLTLMAGDVILTGTPSGVGYAMDPPGLMKAGDIVVCTIDRIGSLTNRIIEV